MKVNNDLIQKLYSIVDSCANTDQIDVVTIWILENKMIHNIWKVKLLDYAKFCSELMEDIKKPSEEVSTLG